VGEKQDQRIKIQTIPETECSLQNAEYLNYLHQEIHITKCCEWTALCFSAFFCLLYLIFCLKDWWAVSRIKGI
jgi:hypothetical protein